MLLKQFLSFLFVAATLNPLCCCSADVLTGSLESNKSDWSWKETSTKDYTVPQKAPCAELESCPIQLLAQNKFVYQLVEYAASIIFPCSTAIDDFIETQRSFPGKIEKNFLSQSFFSRLGGINRLRRHQEICVYLN